MKTKGRGSMERLPVETRSRRRVGVTEGAGKKVSWHWILNNCQECVVRAHFDYEALQSIRIVSNT